jgi:hypothetical protein
MAPANPDVLLALARLLGRDGQAAEALFLLDQLDARVTDEDLLRTRALIWKIEPSLRHSWRYLVARREWRRGNTSHPRRARA